MEATVFLRVPWKLRMADPLTGCWFSRGREGESHLLWKHSFSRDEEGGGAGTATLREPGSGEGRPVLQEAEA